MHTKTGTCTGHAPVILEQIADYRIRQAASGAVLEHLVDDAVFLRLRSGEERVDLDVAGDAFTALAGMLGKRVLEPFAHTHHLLGLDLDVGGLAEALVDCRLVDAHAGVRQPFVPAARMIAAADAAWPRHTVCTSGLMYCIVS